MTNNEKRSGKTSKPPKPSPKIRGKIINTIDDKKNK